MNNYKFAYRRERDAFSTVHCGKQQKFSFDRINAIRSAHFSYLRVEGMIYIPLTHSYR